MKLIHLIALLFSWSLVDLRKARLGKQQNQVLIELSNQWEKRKRKRRKYQNRKWRKRREFIEKTYKLKGTHSKDKRYSNQKMLRRMYTNM